MATASPPEAGEAATGRAGPAVPPYPRPPVRVRRLAVAGAGTAALVAMLVAVLGAQVDTREAGTWVVLVLTALVGAPIAAIDHRWHLIPNWLVAVLAAGTVVACLPHAGAALLGALTVGTVMLGLAMLGGMGMGDVKLGAVCAMAWALHGPMVVLAGFGAGFVLALPATLITMVRAEPGQRGRSRLAMGPWILAGSILTLTWSLLP